ncbi:hypothetical protein [Paenibacillus xylanexedens]|uniref:hypothetical protein n=1 Tax=Paenibacillus xylanexedens TaxID=528191 RepID=UPI000F51C1F2|nr:hypothetical protein [Paenibacillus xylanexedens]
MSNLEINLYNSLIFANENEGLLRAVKSERMNDFRELERLGYIELDQKATGMAIVYVTELGSEYLENQ